MRDFYAAPDATGATRPQHADQAAGLRRLFAGERVRFIAVVANPRVSFAGVLLERIARACTQAGPRRRHTLVVDAAGSAPATHELAAIDLPACIETLAPDLSFLAARGLPLRYVNSRGSCAGLLAAVADAAPQADVVLVHASAGELARLFAQRPVRPLLLAADHPASVTEAYAALKLLAQRNGLMAFDLALAADHASPRSERIAEQLALTADRFVGAVLHDWASIDPATDLLAPPEAALLRLMRTQLAGEAPDDLPVAMPPVRGAILQHQVPASRPAPVALEN